MLENKEKAFLRPSEEKVDFIMLNIEIMRTKTNVAEKFFNIYGNEESK